MKNSSQIVVKDLIRYSLCRGEPIKEIKDNYPAYFEEINNEVINLIKKTPSRYYAMLFQTWKTYPYSDRFLRYFIYVL